jgi:glycosyltransferase involved in cell wall biosynthesis
MPVPASGERRAGESAVRAMSGPPPLSVLVLTYDEEVNLPGCLASVSFSDDVVVYDSYSSDGTVALARAAGARVFQRRFDDYAAQRNAALTEVDYRHPWILMLDADERVTPEVVDEIAAALAADDGTIGLYRIRRRDMFMGRWLRRSSGYPTWFARLLRAGRVRVVRAFNEEVLTDGRIGLLQSHLDHYPFNKGISFWLERHNRYSSMEAATLAAGTEALVPWSRFRSGDAALRRKLLKQVFYRMPLRPLVVFAYLYVARRGFLDGSAGFTYCVLRGVYEYMIDLKLRELRRRAAGLPV